MVALRRAAALVCSAAVLVAAAPLASAASPADTPRMVGSVAVAECGVVKVESSQAWCGVFERPWDPSNPALGTFDLSFAIVLPTDGPTTQPVVVGLEGGPGYGSIASGQWYARMLGPLLENRALLVVDVRGTGRSAPARCPSFEEDIAWSRATAECAALLGARSTLYASALAADDLAALVGAMGLGKVDLYGDSYGTFLAQVVAGHHPEIVRSLVLDGAYPVTGETAWYPTMGPAMRDSFDMVCSRTPSCAKLPGSTVARLSAVLDVVRQQPARVRAPGPDARRHDVVIDASALVGTAFNATYVPTTYREMDAALRAALQGDWLPLGRLVAEYQNSGDSASGGMPYSAAEMVSVSCHDYPQLFSPTVTLTQRPAQISAAVQLMESTDPGVYAPFTITEFRRSDWSALDMCTAWPSGSLDPARRPGPPSGTYPDVPTLVLTGEFDTITTPAEGDMVARQFPRSRHVVVANALHVTAAGNPDSCAPTLVRSFLRDAGAVLAGPPTRCSDSVIRGMPRYPATAASVPLPRAIAQTIADVLDQTWVVSTYRGLGLRGGSWVVGGFSGSDITLKRVELYDGLPVSGTATWDYAASELTATVTARGQTWTARWNTQKTGARAVLTRISGGSHRTVEFLAP